MSEHFLLSDFMGCHSVYYAGYANVFEDEGGRKLAEGQYLCDTLLEPVMAEFGPLSISYGYISPALSRKIVTYQDPDAPSYHRWDKGAAADVKVHSWVADYPPIKLAHQIDETYPYSRMITYSESPYICLATQVSEGDTPRRAFYENRYQGKKGAKPLYIRKAANPEARRRQGEEIPGDLDWRGAGYPTYHGGGRRQYQHMAVSEFSVVSDFLYSDRGVTCGIANAPNTREYGRVFAHAGEFYDALLYALDIPRVSIIRGFESFTLRDDPVFSWKEGFAIDFIPPSYISLAQAAEAAWSTGYLHSVGANNSEGFVRVVGKRIDDHG